ncbi:MAG: NAD(+) synthetase [Candidatus Aenigmatarchaeota archaeon]|nr:MAG: NAD(+) synthetase [Candidatus Aenigmarchaeota archaeon]
MNAEEIANWIKNKVEEANAKGAVIGMSGGVDSSLAAVLCKKALGDNLLGILMPCHSNPSDLEHAKIVAEKFGIPTQTVDLTEIYDKLLKTLPDGNQIAKANLKPRLRMLALYYFANKLGYLVAGTGNKTEIMVGYFTKYGDGGVDIEPIGGLYKTQVRELAKELGIPEEIITKPPSAGLWEGQTDEGEMGITYEELDKILQALEKGDTEGLDPEKVEKVKQMIQKSEHKRKPPEAPEA